MIKLSKNFKFSMSTPDHCCAMVELKNFSSGHGYRRGFSDNNGRDYIQPSQIGLYEAAFTKDAESMEFYAELMDVMNLEFQSNVMTRADNKSVEIIYCVFSDKTRVV